MQSQLERWAHMHPTAPRTGRIHEIPASYLLPRIALIMGLAGVCWWANPKLFWTKKPETLDPEFVAEAKRIGNVAALKRTGVTLCCQSEPVALAQLQCTSPASPFTMDV
ncbi:hypothetical protein QJQ45_025030 [Haematococcus lacustris]|nr:hypothetical protein QJQ45_025030 [Haematococcus lacustris]